MTVSEVKREWSTAMYVLRFKNVRCKITNRPIYDNSIIDWAKKIISELNRILSTYIGSWNARIKLFFNAGSSFFDETTKKAIKILTEDGGGVKYNGVIYLPYKEPSHKMTIVSNKLRY